MKKVMLLLCAWPLMQEAALAGGFSGYGSSNNVPAVSAVVPAPVAPLSQSQQILNSINQNDGNMQSTDNLDTQYLAQQGAQNTMALLASNQGTQRAIDQQTEVTAAYLGNLNQQWHNYFASLHPKAQYPYAGQNLKSCKGLSPVTFYCINQHKDGAKGLIANIQIQPAQFHSATGKASGGYSYSGEGSYCCASKDVLENALQHCKSLGGNAIVSTSAYDSRCQNVQKVSHHSGLSHSQKLGLGLGLGLGLPVTGIVTYVLDDFDVLDPVKNAFSNASSYLKDKYTKARDTVRGKLGDKYRNLGKNSDQLLTENLNTNKGNIEKLLKGIQNEGVTDLNSLYNLQDAKSLFQTKPELQKALTQRQELLQKKQNLSEEEETEKNNLENLLK